MVQLKTLEFLYSTKINFFHKKSQFKLGSFHHFYEYTSNVDAKRNAPERKIEELLHCFPSGLRLAENIANTPPNSF